MSEIKTVQDIRKAFQQFFVDKDHSAEKSSPLLVQDDPTTFFANSGMVQFKDVFTGKETRSYSRATTCQKCLRVSGKHNDYEQIGTTPRHHTFFEMLGNFSFGDYFKTQAIQYGWEFITETLGLDKSKLWVTVHEKDDEAKKLWEDLTDIDPKRIIKLGDETNLWAMGEFGPNGYSSEIFHYIGDDPQNQSTEEFLKDDGTYLEIWNLVFMQFFKDPDGSQGDLPKPCIDTGMGLERIAAIVQGFTSNYDIDLLRKIIAKAESISGKKYEGITYNQPVSKGDQQYKDDVAMRIIADHSRAIMFLVADGGAPSNEGQGYVLRRLIRRMIRSGQTIGIDKPFLKDILTVVEKEMGGAYPEIVQNKKRIYKLVEKEENQFHETLKNGLRLLEEHCSKLSSHSIFPGKIAFQLYDTFGFPVDLTEEILSDRGIQIDKTGFQLEMEKQKARSRSSAKSAIDSTHLKIFNELTPTKFLGYEKLESNGKLLAAIQSDNTFFLCCNQSPFYSEKGGQIGDSGTIKIEDAIFQVFDTQVLPGEQIIHHAILESGEFSESLIGKTATLTIDNVKRESIAVHHSSTHILNAALRNVLGNHISQKGSLVTDEKLRFDFNHEEAVTAVQLENIKRFVNDTIRENHPVTTQELGKDEAIKSGAVAAFGEKYGEKVRVVEIGPSVELCGGTHVKNTGEIGLTIITSESSISSGVRRIEAVCGQTALDLIHDQDLKLKKLSSLLQAPDAELEKKAENLTLELKELKNQIKDYDSKIAKILSDSLLSNAQEFGEDQRYKIISQKVDANGKESLLKLADETIAKLQSGIVILGDPNSNMIIIRASKNLHDTIPANKLLKNITEKLKAGKGGGKPSMATLMIEEKEAFSKAFSVATDIVQSGSLH